MLLCAPFLCPPGEVGRELEVIHLSGSGPSESNKGVGDEELYILVEKFSAKLLRSKFFTRTDDRAMEKMDESFEYKHLSALFTQDIGKRFLRKQIL